MARNSKPLPRKNCGKKPVFAFSDAVAYHANKPEKCNACKRQQLKRQCDRFQLVASQSRRRLDHQALRCGSTPGR